MSLGEQPLANALRSPAELEVDEPRYPLDVLLCTACALSQLTISLSPVLLFRDYVYFSSVIPSLVEHARQLAVRTVAERGLGPDNLVMELASNDGYLLQHYRDASVPVLGIEPARNPAASAEGRGIPTRCEFFGEDLARELFAEGVRPDVLHAHNVLAHVPDLNGFVAGIATLLGDTGTAIVEVPYVKDLLDSCAFDTIYHEHLYYFTLTAIDHLVTRHGLAVQRLERLAIHGGSLRLFIASPENGPADASVAELLAEEERWGADRPEAYLEFAARVLRFKTELRELLQRLKREGARIVGYGAAAKGTTLLNTFDIGEVLECVVDVAPRKQGLHMPGSGLAIRAPEYLQESRPEYLLILAWNFADEIMEMQREYHERGGRFIVPIPQLRIV